jgi:hypothetical protein
MTVSVHFKGEHRARRLRRQGSVEHAPPCAVPTALEEPAAGKRHGGPCEDQALYNCQCGFVFQAHVSTSVGCPHCGGTQAW